MLMFLRCLASLDSATTQLRRTLLLFLSIVLVAGFSGLASHRVAFADGDTCTVDSADNTTPQTNSDDGFDFSISSTSDMQWLSITAPSDQVILSDETAPDWSSAQLSSNQVIFTSGDISANTDTAIHAVASIGSYFAPTNWIIQTSANPDGSNPMACSGQTQLDVQDTNPPVISSVSSGIAGENATISWNTDEPSDSELAYGLDDTYGSSTNDPTDVENHQLTITDLTPGTTYHYQVTSTDQVGNSSSSQDETFIVPSQGEKGNNNGNNSGSGGSTGNQQPLLSSSNSIPILKKAIETTPPTIKLTSSTPRVQKSAPTISGIATDNIAIATVEFSTDGGVNWLPVQQLSGLGTPEASFTFTPVNLSDGTYHLIARAINTSGISATTPVTELVIDRLPPLIGGDVVALGPQILEPDQSGVIRSMAGVDQKITLGTVGGPTSVSVTAINLDGKYKPQSFSLSKSSVNDLWSGYVNFAGHGEYDLIANSIDGAGVRNSKGLNDFNVDPEAATVDASNGKPVSSKVTVYYYVPGTNSWAIWDGNSYGQNNPESTGKAGKFGLFLPAGKYYLTAQAKGYRTVTSSIFTTTQTEPVSITLKLNPIYQLDLGFFHVGLNLPSLADQNITSSNAQNNRVSNSVKNSLINKVAPNFTLMDTEGNTINTANLLGKPTVITFGTTWSPTMAEQIGTLSRLQSNNNLNVIPIAVQQGAAITKAYTTISGLNLDWLVDPNSTTTSSYSVQSLPTSYFINSAGIVKEVFTGVMSYSQIINTLSRLNS